MVQLARWHALGQVEAVSLLRIRHGIVVAKPRREGSCSKGGAANQTVRGWIAFVGTEFADYLRVGEAGKGYCMRRLSG